MVNSESFTESSQQTSWLLIGVIVFIVFIGGMWLFIDNNEVEPVSESIPSAENVTAEVIEKIEPIVELVEIIEEPQITAIAVPVTENILPALDESDTWLQEKLPEITWRKELLRLVIDDDMIRRFVVFTDNFSQGVVAYKHSPFILPQTAFSATETTVTNTEQQEWQWDVQSEKRFNLYVDLLRSFDSEKLIQWYIEIKPLIDQAYKELGYADEDFTQVLQNSITRVLNMELPKEKLTVVRPSVMYKFRDQEVEALDDVDKLLLRLGRENVLVIKSVLLELSEKLSRVKD